MASSSFSGSCLCGTVTFEISPPLTKFVHCHCSRCRKATGTGHATNLYIAPRQLRWVQGGESIARFDLPAAKSFAKWFCRTCGCPLPRLSRSGKTVVVPAGSLDSNPPINPTAHIFWASRAPWACSAGSLSTHAEYPEPW